jgi:hypothetical protein
MSVVGKVVGKGVTVVDKVLEGAKDLAVQRKGQVKVKVLVRDNASVCVNGIPPTALVLNPPYQETVSLLLPDRTTIMVLAGVLLCQSQGCLQKQLR